MIIIFSNGICGEETISTSLIQIQINKKKKIVFLGKINGWRIDPSYQCFLNYIICPPLNWSCVYSGLVGKLCLSTLVFVICCSIGKQCWWPFFNHWSRILTLGLGDRIFRSRVLILYRASLISLSL